MKLQLGSAVLLAAVSLSTAPSAQGPTRLKDFAQVPQTLDNPGTTSYPGPAQIGTKTFFVARTSEYAKEIWAYDSAETGPGSVQCITESLFYGSAYQVGSAQSLIAHDGQLYFTAWTAVHGRELYKSDGTPEGTALLKDLWPGPDGSFPTGFVVFQDQLFFCADDGVEGRELWTTDGTAAGTVMVDPVIGDPADGIYTYSYSLHTRSDPYYAQTADRLYFSAGTHLCYLTLSPDTITTVGEGSFERIFQLGVLGTDVFFGARSSGPNDWFGDELYKFDGVSYSLAEDIVASYSRSSSPRDLFTFGDRLYFRGYDSYPATSQVLFEYSFDSSDPDPANHHWVLQSAPIAPDGEFGVCNGKLFLTADDGVNGDELWVIDATGIASAVMIDPDPFNPGGVGPGAADGVRKYVGFAPLNDNKVAFWADDGVHGFELWESDGTAAGTVMCADYHPSGGQDYNAIYPTAVDGLALCFADNANGWGIELHSYQGDVTPGTTGTMSPVADLDPPRLFGGAGVQVSDAGVIDCGSGFALFGSPSYDATGNSLGYELWRTDGTTAGTVLVKDIRAGSATNWLSEICVVGSLIYFRADDGSVGVELYFANGIPEGQPGHVFGLYADIWPGDADDDSWPEELTNAGRDRLVFSARDPILPNFKRGLFWAAGGQYGLVDRFVEEDGVLVSTPVLQPDHLTLHDGLVYLSAREDSVSAYGAHDIYTTDGRVAQKRTDLQFESSIEFLHFDDANGKLYFAGRYFGTLNPKRPPDVESGWQLYVVNRDFLAPPVRLTNEVSGRLPPAPADLDGTLFFRGYSVDHGSELWTTDGTLAGTSLFLDINPGPGRSTISDLTVIDAGLVFFADDGVHGQEIWFSDGSVAGTAMIMDATPGLADGDPNGLIPWGSRKVIYAYGANGDLGEGLWQCDGTLAGTHRLTQINPGNGNSVVAGLSSVNGHLLFDASQLGAGVRAFTLDLGAQVKSFGLSSAPVGSGRHAKISCSDILLGSSFAIRGEGGLPGSLCGLAVSFVSGEYLLQGLSLYVDPFSFQIAGLVHADSNGDFAFPQSAIPANPAFHGADLVYQAASINPAGLFQSRLTNALYVNLASY